MSKSFQSAERAAKLSWVLPLAGLAFSVMTNQATKQFEDSRTIAIVNAAVLLLLLLSGLICAIYAFCGIPRQGRRGILVPAVIGSVLSGLFLGLFALGFIFAMGYTQPKAKWQDVVSAQGTYQVSIMGNVTRKKSSSGSGQSWAGTLLVLGGIGGILTSWNAFIMGGSRVAFALAESGFLPAAFARIHPRYQTPYVGILVIGGLSIIAPLFGRTILVWLINTGSVAVTIAFAFVAIAFLVLRRTEPEMPRPFKVSHPNLVGYGALVLSIALLSAFFPWAGSALLWPDEWLTILVWAALGSIFWWRNFAGDKQP